MSVDHVPASSAFINAIDDGDRQGVDEAWAREIERIASGRKAAVVPITRRGRR